METTDASVPIHVLEKCYELFHGSLPTAYTKVKSRLGESPTAGGPLREDLNRALTAELYQHIPKPLFIALEEEFHALHGSLPGGYLAEKGRIIAQAGVVLVETEAGTVDPAAGKAALSQLNDDLVSAFYRHVPKTQAALCLSGGGIRSATFGLGMLQALARHGLLDQFQYLSTVSGGGYVGAWLTSWVHRKEQQDPGKGLESVIKELAMPRRSKLDPEAAPIQHLRNYSNYLTPQLGWLSADTWTLIATYLRNLFINWLVWLPLLLSTLLLPRLVMSIATYAPDESLWEVWSAVVAGFVLAGVSMAYINLSLPSIRSLVDPYPQFLKDRQGQGTFLRWCLVPLLISAFLLTSAWAWLGNHGRSSFLSLPAPESLLIFLAIGAFAHALAWFMSLALLALTGGWHPVKQILMTVAGQLRMNRERSLLFFAGNVSAIIVSGTVGGIFAWVLATKIFPRPLDTLDDYAASALPLLLLSFLVAGAIFVALTSRWTTDEDREWWARSSGWILIAMLGWSAVVGIVVFGPVVLFQSSTYAPLLAAAGGLSGLLALVLGFSAKTGTTGAATKLTWQEMAAQKVPLLAAPIALVYIFVGLTYLSSWIIQKFPWLLFADADGAPGPLNVFSDPSAHRWILHHTNGIYLSLFVFLVMTIGSLLAVVLNINKFSLHSIYRNRLIRAYLGASRENRRPDPFTGFDPEDNIQMRALQPPMLASQPAQHRLFHVVNIALNLVQHKKETLAWQERKAESFSMSPLHAGSWRLGYRNATQYGQNQKGIAVRLGTAIAISGAAASPNMGYHSSPAVTFLMTLFNLRLGWWLGNPGSAGNDTFDTACPTIAIKPIVGEAFGFTNDENPYVYLSDGGHFENLGLYEMVLRRCRFILVIDAGHDPDCAFDDLGNAIRKVRVDLGVPIEFERICIYPRNMPGKKAEHIPKYCAIATIRYSRLDKNEPDGSMIYIKPGLCEGEPADVYNYAQTNPAFPHEPTSDQWFSESQFESYRMLGSHILEQMCGVDWTSEVNKWETEKGPDARTKLEFFKAQIDRYLKKVPPPAAADGDGAKKPAPVANIPLAQV
jgi:hypothetical protein